MYRRPDRVAVGQRPPHVERLVHGAEVAGDDAQGRASELLLDGLDAQQVQAAAVAVDDELEPVVGDAFAPERSEEAPGVAHAGDGQLHDEDQLVRQLEGGADQGRQLSRQVEHGDRVEPADRVQDVRHDGGIDGVRIVELRRSGQQAHTAGQGQCGPLDQRGVDYAGPGHVGEGEVRRAVEGAGDAAELQVEVHEGHRLLRGRRALRRQVARERRGACPADRPEQRHRPPDDGRPGGRAGALQRRADIFLAQRAQGHFRAAGAQRGEHERAVRAVRDADDPQGRLRLDNLRDRCQRVRIAQVQDDRRHAARGYRGQQFLRGAGAEGDAEARHEGRLEIGQVVDQDRSRHGALPGEYTMARPATTRRQGGRLAHRTDGGWVSVEAPCGR